MTKAELITAMKDFPDDMEVQISCDFNHRDPAGWYQIERVLSSGSEAMNCILIEPAND